MAAVQTALGVVARRAKDFELHQAIGARVGHRLDGPYYGTLSRLGLAGECTVTELSELLGLELSTVSRRVKALEELGLVERRTHPTDRRTSLLRLTDDGQGLFAALSVGWREMLAEVLAGWDEFDVELFADLFERFADSFECYAADQTGRRPSSTALAATSAAAGLDPGAPSPTDPVAAADG